MWIKKGTPQGVPNSIITLYFSLCTFNYHAYLNQCTNCFKLGGCPVDRILIL